MSEKSKTAKRWTSTDKYRKSYDRIFKKPTSIFVDEYFIGGIDIDCFKEMLKPTKGECCWIFSDYINKKKRKGFIRRLIDEIYKKFKREYK